MLDNRRDGNGAVQDDHVHHGPNGHGSSQNGGNNTHKDKPVDISVATNPKDLASVQSLLKQLNTGIMHLTASNEINHELRQDLSTKARDLMLALETPRETSIKHIWAETGATGAIAWGVDCGLWKLMARNGDRPQKVADLASELGVDPVLLGRLLRHLGAMGYITETGADEYQPNNFTKSLSIDIIGDAYISLAAEAKDRPASSGSAQLKLHEFSRKRGWKNPCNAQDTPVHYAYNTDKDFFTFLQEQGYLPHFHNHMRGYRQGRLPWMAPGFFPVQERLVRGADTGPDSVLLVDIGGSVGHDLEEFRRYHPSTPGRLILQDLPAVIQSVEGLDPSITPMEYDFHKEQPVKGKSSQTRQAFLDTDDNGVGVAGARGYYMHSCLHDWPDDVCESILARVKEAMRPGYSKLLINENVVPTTGAWWESSALDMTMLALLSARERTEADWRELIERKAGLRIVKIWSGGRGVESLIEVELP
ncbi:Demethylsterigmatocystin 6-O-methyltransferase-like protein [Hapsidospora chrysogenum ATCC 11550]|uniref:Demethylsterigmatocystin 6-O-methyltransferase-like protein n=1 Tax=Hapsidospora chrysogenum (strain ATCC 11550 / CBS 779.69 / DSM 880 / IAM 14645 / JCM 23072 / IMI 49137) TaxID=857340 RepID=A0A086SZL9_HAPC1|nr:Demethylsterigmatocystin 6-O-methyltransferase-like protein [Hapsidospora chrysogenum ATCC 11550]